MIESADKKKYFEWDFTPYTDVSLHSLAEQIYVKNWQRTMLVGTFEECAGGRVKVDPYFVENFPQEFPVLQIFQHLSGPNKHDTRIASTFIHTLSRNGDGGVVRAEMEKNMDLPTENQRREKYLQIWAVANYSNPSSNRGLVPRDWITQSYQADSFKKATSVHDIETLEKVVVWLATREGQLFLKTSKNDLAAALQLSI